MKYFKTILDISQVVTNQPLLLCYVLYFSSMRTAGQLSRNARQFIRGERSVGIHNGTAEMPMHLLNRTVPERQAWKLVRPWLRPATLEKISILGTDYQVVWRDR